jgi:hypothetical protein
MEWKIYVNGKLCPIINKGKAEKEENVCNLCKKKSRKQLTNKRKKEKDGNMECME